MAVIGRDKIEQQKLVQSALIEAQRQDALKTLIIKFETADKCKKSFGYIGIIIVLALLSVILLNDLVKLSNYLCREIRQINGRTKANENKKQLEEEENKAALESIIANSQELNEKLRKFHMELIKDHLKRAKNKH